MFFVFSNGMFYFKYETVIEEFLGSGYVFLFKESLSSLLFVFLFFRVKTLTYNRVIINFKVALNETTGSVVKRAWQRHGEFKKKKKKKRVKEYVMLELLKSWD